MLVFLEGLAELEDLLIQEQQVLEVEEGMVVVAAVDLTMVVMTEVEEIQVVIQDSTVHGAQVTLLEEMVVEEVQLVVEMAALEEM